MNKIKIYFVEKNCYKKLFCYILLQEIVVPSFSTMFYSKKLLYLVFLLYHVARNYCD